MPTPIQLTLTMDASGAVSGVDQFNKQIASIGPTAQSAAAKASQGFNGIESAERQAHIAGQLFVRTTGIEMPRALETVIARSQALGPILQGLFGVSVFAAAVPAIIEIGDKIISITENMAGYTEEVKKMEQETIQASRQSFINPSTLAVAKSHLQEINAEIVEIGKQKQAMDQAGPSAAQSILGTIMPGLDIAMLYTQEQQRNAAVAQGIELDKERQALLQREAELQKQITDEIRSADQSADLAGLSGYARIAGERAQQITNINRNVALDNTQKDQLIIDADQEAWGKSVELARQGAQEVMALRHQVVEDALAGTAKIYQAEADQLDELQAKRAQSLITEKNYQDERVLIHQRTLQQIAAYEKQEAQETQGLQEQALESGLTGDQLIIQQAEARIAKERALYAQGVIDYANYSARVEAIDQDRDNKLNQSDQAMEQKKKQILDQAAEDEQNAQEATVLSSVSEWQRGNAQIQIDAQRRIAEIDKSERNALQAWAEDSEQYVAIEQGAQAKREAVWAETNQKILEEHKKQVEQLGADLESVFDDIGSGNIGKRILDNIKKLFFQILANWLMTTKMMGSGFGSLFGNIIFGPGSTGANFFGSGTSGAGGTGILGSFFGGGTSSSFLPGGGSSGLGSLFSGSSSTGLVPSGGFTGFDAGGGTGLGAFSSGGMSLGAGVPGAFAGSTTSAANALSTQSVASTLALGNGGIGGLAAPILTGSLGSLKSGFMGSLPGLVMMGALLGGSKLGGVGQAGAMVSALAVMAAMNPTGAAATALGNFGNTIGIGGLGLLSTLAVAGGGLLGFGLGQQFGPAIGSIGGAGAGLALAALVGLGPVGLAIGAIVGLLGGIFGGLFGGSRRKKQANNYFDQQIAPAIKQIEDQFKSFQLDYPTANSQLEQLRSQAKDQLSKLKGEGKSVFRDKVSPAIDQAEKEIGQFETERERRSGLVFGPPQFHSGGYVEAATSAWTTKPGEMLAVLKRGEFVNDQDSTAKNRPLLEYLNAGGQIGNTHTPAGGLHLHFHSIDPVSAAQWMRRGGASLIQDGLNRYRQEGH